MLLKGKSVILLVLFLLVFSIFSISQNAWQQLTTNVSLDLGAIINVPGSNKLIAVGDSASILISNNMGLTWTVQKKVAGKTSYLDDVFFVNSNLGFAVGAGGTILKTENGGDTWTALNSGITESLYSVFFINEQIGFACGNNGKLIKTTNGGTSWSVISIPADNKKCRFVLFTDSQTGYIGTGYGKLLKTTNGGDNWTVYFQNGDFEFRGADYLNGDIKYMVGANYTSGDSYVGLICSYVNSSLNAFLTNNQLLFMDVDAINNSQIAYAVGAGGSIFKTLNGGEDWYNISLDLPNTDFTSVCFLDENNGFIAGTDGVILKTTSGGQVNIGNNIIKNKKITIYPNPFNPNTNISFNLEKPANVSLELYNANGELVKKLLNNVEFSSGIHQKIWNGTNDKGETLPTGIYFARLIIDNKYIETEKLVLIK